MNEITQARKRAARILTRHGWTRGRLHHRGRYCLHGAIDRAVRGTPDPYGLAWRVSEAIGFPGYQGIAEWNDRQTHKSKVIARLLDGCEGAK